MDQRRAAGALLALAACIACSTAAPTASNQTALELFEGPSEGCYYNFQHYGEGDRIMTNEPCLNCTCHNRMLMCYLKVCPFTKPIGQDCTIEKRADQCCPIVTCPDVPVDLLTSTSTSSPAEYGATGLGKVDKYGCSISGKYFPEGSKVPPTPNKPCEHCYCIRNMTTCVMQECTLHVDGCTPIYHKDVCCPVRYSCDHLEDEMLLLDDMTTTVRPTPGFLLTTTTTPSVTQISQNCVHDDQVFADGALIKTEIACEHCYCMKGDIVCVVQECGTPMENEGKNCTSLAPRAGQCCPDTYICEGDELLSEPTTGYEELTTLSPPRRVEGSGYRNEPDEPYTEIPAFEGSGEEHATTLDSSEMFTTQKQTPQIVDEIFATTAESLKPSLTTIEPEKEQNTVPDESYESTSDGVLSGKTTLAQEAITTSQPSLVEGIKATDTIEYKPTVSDYHPPTETDSFISTDDEFIITTESTSHYSKAESSKITEAKPEIDTETTESLNIIDEITTQQTYPESTRSEPSTVYQEVDKTTIADISNLEEISQPQVTTPEVPKEASEGNFDNKDDQDVTMAHDKDDTGSVLTTTESRIELPETTSVNPVENEINEDVLPPGRIPGEGDCLLNGITYKNNTNVPNINNCHSSCKCMSSIIKCDPIICSPPPEHMDNMNDCQPIYDTPDACCPTYVCHSRETIPPESHSQMSGTESPKPSLESECHGDQCQPHKTQPIPSELCNSDNCKTEIEGHDKECKNGDCEHSETTSVNTTPPPLKHHEDCIGNTCVSSVESCTEGKCQQATPSETVCDNENGCQASEACEGNNCVVGSEVTITTNERCEGSEECKTSETSKCEGSKCNAPSGETQIPNDNVIPLECTEESCRRNDQQQENKSPAECTGSSCIIQGVEGEPSALTTEPTIKDQIYKESTTELINEGYSKLPESEHTDSVEIQKGPHFEVTTENQDYIERSTIKFEVLPTEDLSQTATEKGKPHADSTESHTLETVEAITKIYDKPKTEEYQTIIPEISTTKSEEKSTDSTGDIAKETFTDSPIATQYQEHSTALPIEDLSNIPTKSFATSTEELDIDNEHETHKYEVTDSSVTEIYTEPQEVSTKSTNILVTTAKLPETEVTEQEYTQKQEVFTDSPEEYTTLVEVTLPHDTEKQEPAKSVTQDSQNIETQPDIPITEPAILQPEISTEQPIDTKINENNVGSTEVHYEVTNIPTIFTTEETVKGEQSAEPHETMSGETTTQKIDNEIETDLISTENPNKVISSQTTVHDLYRIDEETKAPQTTEAENLPVNIDTSRKPIESSTKGQESTQTESFDTVTDKQDTYTIADEMQEYVTSVSSITTYPTKPSVTEETEITKGYDISVTQESESKLPESSIKELSTSAIPHELDMKEITTQQPGISGVNIQDITTETIDLDIISETASSGDHAYTTKKDFIEVSTTKSEEIFQYDTTRTEPSITEQQENTTNITQLNELDIISQPIPTDMVSATVSSTVSNKDNAVTVKYTDSESDVEPIGESTELPEVHSTKLDEPISASTETEKKTTETASSSQIENEVITTESIKHFYEDKNEIPDYIQTKDQTQAPAIDESTLVPTVSYTEYHHDSDHKIIPTSEDGTGTEGNLLHATTDTIKEFTEKKDNMLTDDHVTPVVASDTKSTDASEDIHKPTDSTVSNEMENIITHASETTTESQVSETKLPTKLQTDNEIYATPVHEVKEEKGQTESPMSLITEPSESIHSENTDDSFVDKTTLVPQDNVPGDEKTEIPEHYDKNQPIPYTESPQPPEETETKFDSTTPSQTHSEKENQPESSFTSSSPEYITSKVSDIQDEEKTPQVDEHVHLGISAESTEKLAPTSNMQDVTENPTKIYSEPYPSDVSDGSTSVAPEVLEESFATEQEMSTRYPEAHGTESTVSYSHEQDTKTVNIPVKEHSMKDATEQSQNNVDFTTPDSKTSETSNEDHEDIQQETDKTFDIPESEHTISPGLFTTKTPEILDITDDKLTDEHKPSEQQEQIAPELHITTERAIYTEQPDSPDNEIQSSISQDQEKSSEIPQTSVEKDITTATYQDFTTLKEESMTEVPESHLSTTATLTTESSEISPSEENNRRTLSPGFETVPVEQYTTEKQEISELPEVVKSEEMDKEDPIPSKTTESERTTLATINEDFDRTSLIPQSTEGDIVSQTETSSPHQDEKLPVITDSIDKHTTEAQDVTLKPNTEPEDSDKFTKLPSTSITEADEITDKTTVHEDLIKIPVDTTPIEIPSEQVGEELQTETSLPKETDISVPTEIETPGPSIPVEIDMSITKTTESSVPQETKTIGAQVTESSVPEETEASISGVTEASKPEEIEPTISDITESSVHKTPETVSEVTETSVTEPLSSKSPEIIDVSEPKVTEPSVLEITKTPLSEPDNVSEAEVTEVSVAEVTEISVPKETESIVPISDTSVPKETETENVEKESESTTYTPKDEKSEAPVGQSTTLESAHSSSETTPYLVELQEHTTKVDEDISTIPLIEDEGTKAPEIDQTERGDQPFDNLPDKSTQEDSHEDNTVKETFTKKDEQLTTLPPDQASEYTEKVPDKTEITTDKISIPSEPVEPTSSDAQIGQHTTTSEELTEHEKATTTVSESEITTDKKVLPLDTEKTSEHAIVYETTSVEDGLIPLVTKATTVKTPEEVTTGLPVVDDKFIKPEDKPSEPYSPTPTAELPKPGINEIQPTEEVPSPDFSPSGPSGYGQEPDYVEEDQAFGPGTCRYGGKVYVSAQQIPRDDPCDFCFCFRSDIICLQQSCPPPIHGCHEEPIQGFCCPRYECPVSMATTLNVTTTTTTTTTTLPPHFLPHAYKGAAQRRGCQIKGHSYKVGEVVRASSGPCLHCTCGGDGQMKCDPKACTPEPMLRQMIAAAVSAKRRR